jgi:hypothetical protein
MSQNTGQMLQFIMGLADLQEKQASRAQQASQFKESNARMLEQLGIKAVLVEDVSQAEQTDPGEWTITIKFKEFRKPVAALSKPEAAKATPLDPYERAILEKDGEIDGLAEELAR